MLSVLYGKGFIDAGLTSKYSCPELTRQLKNSSDLYKKLYPCNTKGITKRALSWLTMRGYRYLISIDGNGAPLRFEPYLKAPGVVLRVGSHYLQGLTTTDTIPYVHYVPITANISGMKQSFDDSLHWLRNNQHIAINISKESTRWALKHTTERAKNQMWAIIFALHSRHWKGGEPPAGMKTNGPITCENIKQFSGTMHARKSINTACSWDDNKLNDVISKELLQVKSLNKREMESASLRFLNYTAEQLDEIRLHGSVREKFFLKKFATHRLVFKRKTPRHTSALLRVVSVCSIPFVMCAVMFLVMKYLKCLSNSSRSKLNKPT